MKSSKTKTGSPSAKKRALDTCAAVAEQRVMEARKLMRSAKDLLKQTRKSLKRAKKAAKQARREARVPLKVRKAN